MLCCLPLASRGFVSGLCLVFAKYWYDRREEKRALSSGYGNGADAPGSAHTEHPLASVMAMDAPASSAAASAETEALSEDWRDARAAVFAPSDPHPAAPAAPAALSGEAADTVAANIQTPVTAALAEGQKDRTCGPTNTDADDDQRVEEVLASGDLSAMGILLDDICDPVLRNRLLNRLVTSYYRLRADPKHRAAFYRLAYLQIEEAQSILEGIEETGKSRPDHIAAFKSMAIALNEDERHDAAIAVCELALSLGLTDGTKAGFEGRIGRLKKSLAHSGGVHLGESIH